MNIRRSRGRSFCIILSINFFVWFILFFSIHIPVWWRIKRTWLNWNVPLSQMTSVRIIWQIRILWMYFTIWHVGSTTIMTKCHFLIMIRMHHCLEGIAFNFRIISITIWIFFMNCTLHIWSSWTSTYLRRYFWWRSFLLIKLSGTCCWGIHSRLFLWTIKCRSTLIMSFFTRLRWRMSFPGRNRDAAWLRSI